MPLRLYVSVNCPCGTPHDVKFLSAAGHDEVHLHDASVLPVRRLVGRRAKEIAEVITANLPI